MNEPDTGFFEDIEHALVHFAGTPTRLLSSIVWGAVICLGMNHAVLWFFFRKRLGERVLESRTSRSPLTARTGTTLAVIGGTAVAYTAGADLSWAAAAGFVALMLLHRRDTRQLWGRIDWSLLHFFAGLFVAVEGLIRSGGPAPLFARFPLSQTGVNGMTDWMRASGIFLVGSNIVSNVPFILVVQQQMASLSNPKLGWELLTVASTFAGNLTLLGSVANIIVAESARDVGGMGFLEHLKVGLPLAIGTTLVGVVWIVLVFPG